MKKILYFLLFSLLLVSCKDDFDIGKLQDASRLVVYCFPTVGDTTIIMVTKSVPVATAKGERDVLTQQPVDADIIYKVNGEEYPVRKIATEEEAKKISNSEEEYYNKQVMGQYYVVGKQKAGDNVSVEVNADGYQPVFAATYIPLSVNVRIEKSSFKDVNVYSGLDHIWASFVDEGDSKDYYSVKVRKNHTEGAVIGIDPNHYHYQEPVYVYDVDNYKAINKETPGMVWSFDSLFQANYVVSIDTEKEPVFNQTTKIDEDLGFDDYSYYALSYIFDDHLFNGKKYTLHLNLASIYGNNYYYYSGWDKMFGFTYSVELYKLTPEYYRYLSSINSAQSNSWAEAGIMQVTPTYSNVKGGFGVVAGYNATTDSIRIEPSGDEDDGWTTLGNSKYKGGIDNESKQ